MLQFPGGQERYSSVNAGLVRISTGKVTIKINSNFKTMYNAQNSTEISTLIKHIFKKEQQCFKIQYKMETKNKKGATDLGKNQVKNRITKIKPQRPNSAN